MTDLSTPLIDYSPDNYQQQLEDKIDVYKSALAALGDYAVEVHPSAPLNFRMRAEFRIWHEDGSAHYAMNRAGDKRPYIIDNFLIGGSLINQLMPLLLDAVNSNPVLSKRLFSAEFLTTTSGEALITLIYHRPLDSIWEVEARKVQNDLNIAIIGRSRKQKVVLDRDYVTEKLTVRDREYLYQQVESGFTQPNAGINVKMLSWASECCSDIAKDTDLLELYCGNGNFTAVLAQHYRNVLATEVSKVSVTSAQRNFEQNDVDNVTVVRLSSEEMTQALNGVRSFRRLKAIDLDSYNFSTIFVDPPRAGLDSGTLKLVAQFDQVLYISCNPETQMGNLSELMNTHEIQRVAVFDQFPWTHHLESSVLLKRRS
ncbi:MAG: tRNA (uridine(54)-C5)-methyltransferase TrmA [Proteobacteria bacterium]|nr:tRNA (uridine(54)-C5)-methyltransferase TrmA [Pseudomonadota bacterium]MDA1351835.1 tRNA (uridine(54)-C5)-methyltransferase TrmA [Pseudomonadota bacterium]